MTGGSYNTNSGYGATIGGGAGNNASGFLATVGGGGGNISSGSSATVGGGNANTKSGLGATIGGGLFNTASGGSSTVPGGAENFAGGDHSFAAGYRASATNQGAFVWADTQPSGFASSNDNSFNVRAGGGVVFATGGAGLTLDGQPVLTSQLAANDVNHSNIVNMVEGSSANSVPSGVYGATIAGGGAANYFGGSFANSVTANFGAVGGGGENSSSGFGTVVAGGIHNSSSGQVTTVGGGTYNNAAGNSTTVGGGAFNTSSGQYTTVGGGYGNQATNDYATVPGGWNNVVGGKYTFAAGFVAQALHQGAFVWADSLGFPFTSTANDQFLIRAQGGVGIGTTAPASALHVASSSGDCEISVASGDSGNHRWTLQSSGTSHIGTFQIVDRTAVASRLYIDTIGHVGVGVVGVASTHLIDTSSGAYLTTGGAWTSSSDRNVKDDFASIQPSEVLAKVAAMPVTQWKYKVEPAGIKHIGPMAQDFHAAFGLGDSDKAITSIDEGGVALAAIQGLNQKVEQQSIDMKEKDAEIQDLKQSVAELKNMVQTLADRK